MTSQWYWKQIVTKILDTHVNHRFESIIDAHAFVGTVMLVVSPSSSHFEDKHYAQEFDALLDTIP